MEFIFSSLHTSFSNSVADLLKEIEFDDRITLETTIAYINIWLFFILVNMVDLNKSVWDVLMTIWAMSCLFKSLINFTLVEFEILAQLVVLTIISHARSIAKCHHVFAVHLSYAHNNICLISSYT
jgi:hypothetical protein